MTQSHDERNSNSKYYLIIVFFVLALLFGTACHAPDYKTPGFLYFRLDTNPTTLDPALIVDVTGSVVAAKLFNGLVSYDRTLSLQPDIAEKWTVSEDGTLYTFYLKPAVRFSNDREVTAADFKYSFERVLNPATRSPRTWVLDRIKGAKPFMKREAPEVSGIRARNPGTLEIELEKPFGPFLSLLSLPTAYVVPKEEVGRWGPDFSFHVVGTGPFILEEWAHGQHLLLAANKHYFSPAPSLQGICYRIIPEDLTTMVEFETGNLDIIQIPAAELRRYRNDPQWKTNIVPQPALDIYYLGLNCRKAPLNDVRVRQAICLAIDREKMLNTLYEHRGTLASGPIPPLLRRNMPPLASGYAYDPPKACELLKEAGLPDGFTLQITITAQQETLDIVEVIQQYLQKVNIRATIAQLEWSSFKEVVSKGETDAFWLSWWADYPDAENFLYPLFHSSNWGSGGNHSFYQNARVDRFITQAQTAPDESGRAQLYQQAEEIIAQEVPAIFFWHKTDYYLFQPWVHNFTPHCLSTSDKGVDTVLEKTLGE